MSLTESPDRLITMRRLHMDRIKIGQRIRHFRQKLKMTQEQLGEKCGLNYKYVGEVERGAQNISIDTMSKIASALKVELADLIPREKDKIEEPPRNKIEKQVHSFLQKLDEKQLRKAFDIIKTVFK
jgi:transcriptional regulator with XRE-family HTH domain